MPQTTLKKPCFRRPCSPQSAFGSSEVSALTVSPSLPMSLLFDEVDSLLVFLAGAEHLQPQLSSAIGTESVGVISDSGLAVSTLVEQVQTLTDMLGSFEAPL